MNEIINPAIPLKKVNRKFSLEDKKVLYQQWKMSNQTKHAFCKAQRFTKTSFYKWCQKFIQMMTSSFPRGNIFSCTIGRRPFS